MYLQNVSLYLDQSLGTLSLFSTLIGRKITLFCARFRKLSQFEKVLIKVFSFLVCWD